MGVATAVLAVAVVLAACSSSPSGSPSTTTATAAKALKGGTATFALSVGAQFSWMLPLPNQANYEPWDQDIEYGMWQPLYFAGNGSRPVIDPALSLAYPPVWSDGNRTVSITLKPWKWSDGKPVTTRDIEFFFNLYKAGRSSIATYIPGDIPDNVAAIDYVSPTKFVLHLKTSVSQQWYDDNQLTDIIPMPQHAWDRESSSQSVGNYDLTPSGAAKVFKFLSQQSKTLGTYATNPLWKTVDGPWTVSSYSATTSRTVLAPNLHYTGPDKPHLSEVIVESFSSDTAEVDALRSGSVTYGWLPFSDLGLSGYFNSHGYTVAPWAPEYVQWAELGYTSPVYGPLVRQLYIRQALQHLVNEPLYLKATLHGDGQLTYGPVPNLPGSPYVSPQERINPYPYSVSSARSLLLAHGWQPGSNGVMTCKRPGVASNECGKGIASGRQLKLLLMYTSGYPTLAAQVQAFGTAASSAGVGIALDPQTETTMFSVAGVCPPGPCNWGIAWYSNWLWNYGQSDVYPTGGQMFSTGNYWGGGYSSAEANHLIQLTHQKSGLNYLYAYENYISRQVAALWAPTWDNQISVVSNKLHGWQPQQVFADPLPQNWYLSS